MARKKRRVVRKRKPIVNSAKTISSKFKFGIVLRNLIVFVLLALVSYLLYYFVFENTIFVNLFYFLWIVFGFIALAFLIALLVLLFMRWMKKK